MAKKTTRLDKAMGKGEILAELAACGSREFDHPEISHVISMAIDGCRDGIESAWRPR
ncbi:MAG TPA: hypothetical protein VF515_07765 [Candidatus Binatia bacterium]